MMRLDNKATGSLIVKRSDIIISGDLQPSDQGQICYEENMYQCISQWYLACLNGPSVSEDESQCESQHVVTGNEIPSKHCNR